MLKSKRVIVIWFVVNSFYCLANGHAVDLFSAKDRHGNAIRMDVSDRDCTNVPIAWIGRIASVDTMGNCMQFYEHSFCKGSLTVLQPFHVLHQMDLSLINFANTVESMSPCGPKVSEGRYVIQSAADASIMTVVKNRDGFSTVSTKKPSQVIEKPQQWDITEKSLSEFQLKPREHEDNYPVSFDEKSLQKGKIVRKRWQLLSVGRGRYIIKSLNSKDCLYKTDEQKVEENTCRVFSPNQEWVLRSVLTPNVDAKPTKSSAATGPGLNLNILSKVSQYRPLKADPKPELIPIYLNASIAHQITRPSSTSPYQIRKKIKRGPRPQSQQQTLAIGLRPPGLRPALPSRISNNNDFLLLKLPSSQVAKRPLIIPDGLPRDKEIVSSDGEGDPEDKEGVDSNSEEKEDDDDAADEEEDEEENEEDGEGKRSNIRQHQQHFRTSREKSRPLLEIVVDNYPKINAIEMDGGIGKYRNTFNRPPVTHHSLFSTSSKINSKQNQNQHQHTNNKPYPLQNTRVAPQNNLNTQNRYKYDTSASKESTESKEDSFMQLFVKKFKEKMTSVGSRWSRKQQQKNKPTKQVQVQQPHDDFETFLEDIL